MIAEPVKHHEWPVADPKTAVHPLSGVMAAVLAGLDLERGRERRELRDRPSLWDRESEEVRTQYSGPSTMLLSMKLEPADEE